MLSSNSSSDQPDQPTTNVNNKLLAVNIDHYPFEETYNEEDLNINWNPDTQKYTGFLPVTVKATGVPSYTSFYADVDGQLFQQPIQYNGKYKFILKDDGPFATGLMPQFMRDQTSNNYDININVPIDPSKLEKNTATLQITDGVLDSVLQLENGILNLPNASEALNQATRFNTNGKDYATSVSIDLTNLTYYSSMPEIDNGNDGNVIEVDENNVEITLLDDNNNKTNIEHTVVPYVPNQTKRPIKAVNLTKDSNMRDVTDTDIVGYIRVNVPPPNITQTVQNNGYYKFNSNWNGLIEGTEQDHALSVNVNSGYYLIQDQSFTLTQNPQTFTIPDSYNENILPTIDTVNRLSGYISIGYGGNSSVFYYSRSYDQQYLERILSQGGSNQYWYAYGTESTNVNTNTRQGAPNILGFNLGASVKIKNIEFYMTGSPDEFYLLGSNDINFYDTMINMNDNGTVLNYINNDLTPSNIIWHKTNIPPSNNVFHKEYEIFDDDNFSYKNYVFVFMSNNSGRNWVFINGLKFISNFKNAMKTVTITSNLPTNPTLYTQPTIEDNGTYNVPNGYDGFAGPITVSVPPTNPTLYTQPTINTNGTYNLPSGYDGFAGPITVYIPETVNIEPTKYVNVNGSIGQGISITPSSGYDALSEVYITVVPSKTDITGLDLLYNTHDENTITYPLVKKSISLYEMNTDGNYETITTNPEGNKYYKVYGYLHSNGFTIGMLENSNWCVFFAIKTVGATTSITIPYNETVGEFTSCKVYYENVSNIHNLTYINIRSSYTSLCMGGSNSILINKSSYNLVKN